MCPFCENLFYYLSCGICFSQQHSKELMRRQNEKNKIIDSIISSKQTNQTTVKKTPEKTSTKEMSDWFLLPNDTFKTENEVILSLGYELNSKFESGGFASIYYVIHIKTGIKFALKKVNLPQITNEKSIQERKNLMVDLKNELYVLEKLRHPNIIQLIQHFGIEKKTKTCLFIIMKLAVNGSLSQRLNKHGPFDESQCKLWFAQILSGLNYMHSQGFAHRDMKPANLLLDEKDNIMISDFGLSRLVWTQKEGTRFSGTLCGTLPFIAPEVLSISISNVESPQKYNAFKADVWSLAVTLFKMFANKYPFELGRGKTWNITRALVSMKSNKWKQRFPTNRKPSKELFRLFERMFTSEPELRADLIDVSQHIWIQQTFLEVEDKYQGIPRK